jgi:hypothetical protein
MRWSHAGRTVFPLAAPLGLLGLLVLGAGCKKRPPPAAPTSPAAATKPSITCPSKAEIARALGAADRRVEADCLAYGESMFWLAGALVFGATPAEKPRLALVSGSPWVRWLVYDVDPAPLEAIDQLVRGSEDVQLRMRNGRRERRLVRLGVVGRPKKGAPDSVEILTLLRLGGHGPPEVVWTGKGDEVTTTPGGCVSERSIDFELLFGTRVEMFTTNKTRKPAADCPGGMDLQETLTSRPVRMKPGRPIAGTGPDAGRPG